MLKRVARIIIDFFAFFYGVIYYCLNKSKPLRQRTPSAAHLSMIRFFCLSSGYSNDIANKIISFFDKPITLPNHKGILGDYSKDDLKTITKTLDEEGYYIFEKKLPEKLIEKFYTFALNAECTLRRSDNDLESTPTLKGTYDKSNPKSSIYDISLAATVSNQDVQALLRDHSILSVAQSYLRASPKVDYCAFWWSTAFSSKAQANAAQMFHFDMDRFKWLKFFIFLTDVTIENGPHVFISKSHISSAIPRSLLKAGYSRLEDEKVLKYYPQENIKTFTVPAGTIIAEDTRGLHKGTPLIKGERLVLELQFSNSLFGAISPSLQEAVIQDKDFLAFAREHHKIFKLYPI